MNTVLVGSFFSAARTSGVSRRLGRSEGLGCLAKQGAIGHSRSSREWESRCEGKEGEACVDATRRRTSWRSGGAQGRSWCSFSSLQLMLSLHRDRAEVELMHIHTHVDSVPRDPLMCARPTPAPQMSAEVVTDNLLPSSRD